VRASSGTRAAASSHHVPFFGIVRLLLVRAACLLLDDISLLSLLSGLLVSSASATSHPWIPLCHQGLSLSLRQELAPGLVPSPHWPLNCTGSLQVSLTHWIILTLVVCVNHCREEAGINLESPDQKTRGFVVQIAFLRWFLKRAHQVFGEIPVRI
jgi:hypothetical protein